MNTKSPMITVLGALAVVFGLLLTSYQIVQAQEFIPKQDQSLVELSRLPIQSNYLNIRWNGWSDYPEIELRSWPTDVFTVTNYYHGESTADVFTKTVNSEGYSGLFNLSLELTTVETDEHTGVSFWYSPYEGCPRGVTMSLTQFNNNELVVALRNFSDEDLYFRQTEPADIGEAGSWRDLPAQTTEEPRYQTVDYTGTIIIAQEEADYPICAKIHWIFPELAPPAVTDVRVELSASADTIASGDVVTLTVGVYNDGSAETEVAVSMPLPDGPDWQDVRVYMPASAQTFAVPVTLTESFTFTVTALSTVTDTNLTNNAVTVTVEVLKPGDFPVAPAYQLIWNPSPDDHGFQILYYQDLDESPVVTVTLQQEWNTGYIETVHPLAWQAETLCCLTAYPTFPNRTPRPVGIGIPDENASLYVHPDLQDTWTVEGNWFRDRSTVLNKIYVPLVSK